MKAIVVISKFNCENVMLNNCTTAITALPYKYAASLPVFFKVAWANPRSRSLGDGMTVSCVEAASEKQSGSRMKRAHPSLRATARTVCASIKGRCGAVHLPYTEHELIQD